MALAGGSLVLVVLFLSMSAYFLAQDTVHLADPATPLYPGVPSLVVAGAGFGLMVAPIGMFTIADVPVAKAGAASGLFNTTTQLAHAVGVAILGTLFFAVAERQLPAVPADVFGPAYEAVLLAVVVLMAAAYAAARALPRAAVEQPTDGVAA